MLNADTGTVPNDRLGDVGELYGLLARRLEQLVQRDVRAPEAVIEDACQIAWSRLLRHRDRVQRETVMGWLLRTAVREALRLSRRDRRELPLEATDQEELQRTQSSPVHLVECRERIAELGRLPERQQRAVWLHAIGLNYGEIAEYEGCTARTVERQLLRARQAIRHPEAA
jgi:RNA polymerase sigma factor (sigma-70 family)